MIYWDTDSKVNPTWFEVTIHPETSYKDRLTEGLAAQLLSVVNEIGLRGYHISLYSSWYDWEDMANHYRFVVEYRGECSSVFRKYRGLFIGNILNLKNPLVKLVGKLRGVYPNDDMFGTLTYLDRLINGFYEEERGEQRYINKHIEGTGGSD